MENDLSNYRKNYNQKELLETNCPSIPIDLFKEWFSNADNSNTVIEANAMSISTIGIDGFPKTRIVLLKKYSEKGFIFYTNYESEKGIAIQQNPNVSLSFFWAGLEQQIIIKGKAKKVSKETSQNYFNSRPEGSRIGAWASNQSRVVDSKEELNKQLIAIKNKFKNKTVVKPENWGGYIIEPISFEFWQGRPNRMHDRIRYSIQKDFSWKLERLAP